MFQVPAQSVLWWLQFVTVTQTILLLVTCLWAGQKGRTYPAMRGYLAVNATGGLLICGLLRFPVLMGGNEQQVYTAVFWTAYAASGFLTFLTAQQIFRDALKPLPGLRRLALVAFRWVALASVVLSVVPALVPLFLRAQPLHTTVLQAMRCISIIEFCLLAFILLSAQALGISYRSRIVGLTLGFGMLAVVDTLCSLFLLQPGAHLLPWLAVRESGSLIAVCIWLVYFVMPEPGRASIEAAPNSQLRKWNEIATALGKPAPHIALGPQPSAFFLQDVEKVVDRVLSRNVTEPPASS